MPAGRDGGTDCGGSCEGFEILGERKVHNKGTGSCHRECCRDGVSSTVGDDTYLIGGHRGKVADGATGLADIAVDDSPAGIGLGAVFHVPCRLGIAGSPHQLHAIGSLFGDERIGCHTGGQCVARADEPDIGAVGTDVGAGIRTDIACGISYVVLIAINGASHTAVRTVCGETRGIMALAGGLVDKGRQHEVAHTVPHKGCVEGVLHRAHIGGGAGAGIDLRHASCQRGKTAESGVVCLTQEDDDVLGI